MTLPGPFWFLAEPFPWEDLYYGELEGEGGAEQPRVCSLISGEKQNFILLGRNHCWCQEILSGFPAAFSFFFS